MRELRGRLRSMGFRSRYTYGARARDRVLIFSLRYKLQLVIRSIKTFFTLLVVPLWVLGGIDN